MTNNPYSSPLLDQTRDRFWAVDHHLYLVYANKAYLNLMKEVTGREKKLYEPVLIEGFGDGYIEKWKAYFERGLKGEHFEIEEHFYNPSSNLVEYSQIAFNPIIDENQVIVNVACQSRDITSLIKSKTEAEVIMDASLDVICQINEFGNFTKVSAACKDLWGYEKEELVGKAYIDFVIDEDLEKTNEAATDIIDGKLLTTFENRYKRKDGGVAFNLWSARWEPKTQIMFCVARDAREKIKKEELLIQSEQRFKALVQEGSDMISIIDTDGNYMYTTPNTTEILGITPEEFQGRSVFDFIHPDDIERASGYMQRISTESKVIVEPFRLRDGNNEWRWIETILTNMVHNPAVGGIVANSRDITARVYMLKDKEVNEQFNKTVLESSPDCLKILNKEGQLLYMNFNGLRQMEIDDFSEFKNKKWTLLWGQENEALIKGAVDKALMGETISFTAFCPTAKGTPKWWDVTVSPVSVVGEPIQQIISVSRDITKKKAEEQRLKLLESVVVNATDSVLITEAEPFDEPGPRILYVNEAFTKMTGYTSDEVIGKTPRILQGPKSDKAEIAKLSKSLRNWEPCEITTVNYKKNGDEFWINFSVSPVADETGWYTHWIAIERDVTEQKTKELENELVVQISSTFNLVNDFEKATIKLCEIIGLYGKLDWVELWTPNLEMTEMRLISHYVRTPEDEIFYTDNYHVNKFSKDEGLIGKVWASRKQILWDDVTKRNEFIRADSAKKIGLKSVLGIPLIFNNEVLGVLTVGVKSKSDYLKNYTRIFERLEKFIGSELQRKTLEIELSLLFDTIPDIISVGDFQGRFLRINKPGCKLLGYDEEEILKKGFEEFIHPEDLSICYEEIQQLQNGKDTFGFEVRFITRSGEILWLSWYCKAKINEGLIYCTAKNITEEKKLRELNRQSRKLAKIGSWEVDMLTQSIFWTDEVHQMHETDASSFKPTMEQAVAFYREDFRETVNQSIEKSINTGEPFDFEAVIVTANKKELWVRAIGNVAFANGKCTSIYGSFQDIHERKIAEQQKNSLLTTLEKSLNEIYVFDAETLKFSYVNQGALINIGYSEQEIKTLTPLDLKPEFTATTFNQLVNPLVTKEKEKIIFFTNHKRKNGSLYPVEVHLQLVAEGNNKRFLAVILDIQERTINEIALRESLKTLEDYKFSLDQSAIVAYTDSKGVISFVNNNFCKISQYSKEELIGKTHQIINSKHHPKEFFVDLWKTISSGKVWRGEIKNAAKDGSYYWVDTTIVPFLDENNKPVQYLAIRFDVTDRKIAEDIVLKTLEEKTNILERITEAFVSLDTNWCYTYMNKQAGEIFNRNPEKMVGKHIWTEFPEGLNQPFHLAYEKAMATQEYIHVEEHYKPYDLWFENHIYPSQDGISIFFRDVTERKLSELEILAINEKLNIQTKELQRSNEELEQFAFVASHDLQEPLRMISSFMDQLKRKYADRLDEKGLQYIHYATDGAKRMKQIILDLLLYSRANKTTEQNELINLNEIVSEYKQLRRKVIAEKRATITNHGLPTFETYRAPITQIFHCLLDNALKYVDENKPPLIEITAIEKEDVWQFAIKDNGIGIDQKFFDKIFIIFQRLQNRKEHDGTGIGLAIAKRSIEFLGGEIWVESEIDKGSTFYFTIHKLNNL